MPESRRRNLIGIQKLKNETLLVIGYGSLLSGYGMLAERRGGRSRLVAREAFPVSLENARRGLAKPSSHGDYLAMDIEPVKTGEPITAKTSSNGGVGAIGLVFDREWAPPIARREEYSPEKFAELIELADRAGKPLGEFLLEIAERTRFDLLRYRSALRQMLGYTSPGYIFHPVPLDDGRVAIVAIGSGFEGSGDPAVVSRRSECGTAQLLGLNEALSLEHLQIDREGQVGYFVEAILGGVHGVEVGDLIAHLRPHSELLRRVGSQFTAVASGERDRFMKATSLSARQYQERFGDAGGPELEALYQT